MQEFLDRKYLYNTYGDFLIVIGTIIALILIAALVSKLIFRALKKKGDDENSANYILYRGLKRIIFPLIYIAILYFGITELEFPHRIDVKIHSFFIFILTFLAIRTIIGVIRLSLNLYFKAKSDGASREKQISGIVNIASFLIWSLGLIFLLDNLGFKVSTVIAGLGVGGIAIALAAQAILGDLFSYFVIFFDRPFEIGDFIVVGEKSGTVENIGIKTTRLRSISGEQIVFSNTNLTSSQVHNYKRMERRRIIFRIRAAHNTPADKLEVIPEIITNIIKAQDNVHFERCHLANFSDIGFNFEAVYFVNSADYNEYMNIQQQINLSIYKEFNKQSIQIAFVTAPVQAG